jgi:PRC-barrel domain.
MSERRFYRREEIIGKIAINMLGKSVGSVKDIAYDSEGRMALIVDSKDEGEKYFSIDEIVAIGDYVLVGKAKSTVKKCQNCGFENKLEYKYCMNCGKPI